MLLLIVNALIVSAVVIAVTLCLKKYLVLSRTEKIEAALDEQELAAKLAQKSQQINPEEINNNNSKVKTTLDNIKE